jgi:glycine dehydrogenase subunit 2
MKHNPRLNEKMARLPGFADIHPLQPQDTTQGALELIATLGEWLVKLTGMHSVAMSPKAGAHGELCGLLAIRSALEARGDKREVVLVPESAHGTNPATAAFAGYRVENIPATERGRVDLEALKARLGPDVAGVMITNPNTCGLFEPDMTAISEAVHAAGGSSIVTEPISTPSSGACGRATSASMRCTSTCIRPSPPRMAAAGRARVRWSSPKR